MEIILSSIALIVSIASFTWSVKTGQLQRRINAQLTNNTNIVSVESKISEIPSILRFHGIEKPEEELNRHGVTAEEFAYLLCSFGLGGAYYRAASDTNGITKGSYRYKMCQSPSTRRAWSLLRQMLEPDQYRDQLDAIFSELDKESPLTLPFETSAQQLDEQQEEKPQTLIS